ncbi:MAG: hypothetical protein HY656_07760 [Acidobacteria bacterium]|nr:hypothetical protein [Acidobacteriota bacterium]
MRSRQSGYALLIVLLLAALVLISLSTAVPRFVTQGQREKEEELIFRGEQYRRAIGRFYRAFGRYPRTLEELLRTNERGFLRREFRDPMTPDGRWRLIRVGPSGEFIGSLTRQGPAGQPESGRTANEREAPRGSGQSETGESTLPLAGVASHSQARAIRVYHGYGRYSEWEFIYDPTQDGSGQPPGSGTPPQAPPVPPPPGSAPR